MVFWAHLLGGTAEHIYAHDALYVCLVQAPWRFGTWGVELFFTISGFVILPSIRRYSLGQFALRRFLRLYPLFLVLSLLFIALNVATNAYPAMNNIKAVAGGLLFLNLFTHTEQLTPNAWSLTYEVMFYTLTATGYYYAITRRSRFGTVTIAVLSCLFLFRYPIAAFFLGGILIRLMFDRGIKPPREYARAGELATALACVLLAGSHHFGFSQKEMASPYAWALMACTISYFFFAVQPDSLTSSASRNTAINYLGKISYSLYLIHPYTYYAIRILFVKLGLFYDNSFVSIFLFFLITTPVTLVITQMAHKVLEVGPYQLYFHQKIYRAR